MTTEEKIAEVMGRWERLMELPVQYERSGQFRGKIDEIPNLVIINVVEIVVGKCVLYVLDVPKDQHEYVEELAFMTFIKNPEFQKYYK